MHFLIGLGILAGLVWFAFGASAARAIVGVALLAVAAFFGFIFFVAAVDIHRQSVEQAAAARNAKIADRKTKADAGLAIRVCLAQRWDYDAQMECEQAARDRNPGVAPTEISRMVDDAAADNQRAALADNALDRVFPASTNADVKAAIHRAAEEYRQKTVRECMAEHNSGRDAQTECDK
jgi:hypothetical protein